MVLTAMHGVGAETALAVLAEAGVSQVHRVVTQIEPDPDFPTVPFPNPEEPGAMDLALELAASVDADVVIGVRDLAALAAADQLGVTPSAIIAARWADVSQRSPERNSQT